MKDIHLHTFLIYNLGGFRSYFILFCFTILKEKRKQDQGRIKIQIATIISDKEYVFIQRSSNLNGIVKSINQEKLL